MVSNNHPIADATHVTPDGTLCIPNIGPHADGTVLVWDQEAQYWSCSESSDVFERSLIKLKK